MPFNSDGTRAERTDPPSAPPDLPDPGGMYPDPERIAPIPEIVALGVCSKCGFVHTCCKGHSKAWAGAPCSKYRRVGQLICDQHGARAPQNIRAAAKRLATQQATHEAGALLAEAELAIEGMSLADQLVQAIQRAGAMALSYRWLLDQLPHEATWRWEEHRSAEGAPTRWVEVADQGLLGPNARGELQLHAYEEGHRYWTTLHGKLLIEAARLGLDERRQLFAEQQVATMGDAVVELVEGLGMDLADPAVVPVVEAFLRKVAGEPGRPAIEASGTDADSTTLGAT